MYVRRSHLESAIGAKDARVHQNLNPPGAAKCAPVGPQASAGPAFPAALPGSGTALDQMVAHFIDVSQGDAVLLEFSCAAVLIDTGGEGTDAVVGRDPLQDYLSRFFLRVSVQSAHLDSGENQRMLFST